MSCSHNTVQGGGFSWHRFFWAYRGRSTTFQRMLTRSLLVQKDGNVIAKCLICSLSLTCSYLTVWYPYAAELKFLTL